VGEYNKAYNLAYYRMDDLGHLWDMAQKFFNVSKYDYAYNLVYYKIDNDDYEYEMASDLFDVGEYNKAYKIAYYDLSSDSYQYELALRFINISKYEEAYNLARYAINTDQYRYNITLKLIEENQTEYAKTIAQYDISNSTYKKDLYGKLGLPYTEQTIADNETPFFSFGYVCCGTTFVIIFVIIIGVFFVYGVKFVSDVITPSTKSIESIKKRVESVDDIPTLYAYRDMLAQEKQTLSKPPSKPLAAFMITPRFRKSFKDFRHEVDLAYTQVDDRIKIITSTGAEIEMPSQSPEVEKTIHAVYQGEEKVKELNMKGLRERAGIIREMAGAEMDRARANTYVAKQKATQRMFDEV